MPLEASRGVTASTIYVDIMTGEKLSSAEVANMDISYWSVCSSSRRRVDGVKGVVTLANYKLHLNRN